MKCTLEKKINHKDVDKKFKDTLFFCRLFEKEDIGMNRLGIVCGHCCIRNQMVSEKLAELVLKNIIRYEDYERNPEILYEHLSGELLEYARTVSEMTGKNWEEIRGICNRCKPLEVEPLAVPKAPATKMSNIARREV